MDLDFLRFLLVVLVVVVLEARVEDNEAAARAEEALAFLVA